MKVLETDRLILRHITKDDAGFIIKLMNEPSFIQNIGDKKVSTKEDACRYILDGPVDSYERFGFGLYLVELKNAGTAIGICGLIKRENLTDTDIGFAFLPEFRSKGYAYESASAVLRYAKEACGLNRILGITSPDNTASIAVLEKLGLKFESMIRLNANSPEIKLYAVNL